MLLKIEIKDTIFLRCPVISNKEPVQLKDQIFRKSRETTRPKEYKGLLKITEKCNIYSRLKITESLLKITDLLAGETLSIAVL